MAQTIYKFKAGDLVRHDRIKTGLGVGIVIGPLTKINLKIYGVSSRTRYDVYWTKKGFDWHLEEYLVKVSNDGTNKI